MNREWSVVLDGQPRHGLCAVVREDGIDVFRRGLVLIVRWIFSPHFSVHYKSHNKVHDVRVRYGSMPVRFPIRPDADLHLVVVKWPKGEKPMMMLLTTLDAVRTRKTFWRVVQARARAWP